MGWVFDHWADAWLNRVIYKVETVERQGQSDILNNLTNQRLFGNQ